jgi:hypothetical protein
MVSLRRPLFEEYDVIRPSGPIGKRCATRQELFLSTPFRASFRKPEVEGLRIPVGRGFEAADDGYAQYRNQRYRHSHSGIEYGGGSEGC